MLNVMDAMHIICLRIFLCLFITSFFVSFLSIFSISLQFEIDLGIKKTFD